MASSRWCSSTARMTPRFVLPSQNARREGLTMNSRTQVGIVGAGPAGLLLSHLLHRAGIDSVVLESRSRDDVEGTIRAGVLEQGTVDLLKATGVGERLQQEGFRHEGIYLRFDGEDHRIDFPALTNGKAVTVYAQHEVIKDLVKARIDSGSDIRFQVSSVTVHDVQSEQPSIRYRDESGTSHEISCDFVAGCDGTQGVCRPSIPAGVLTAYEKIYPFGWFGILCEAPPSSDELIYALHDRGFALVSTRSPTVQRMYCQVDPADRVDNWSDDRIWKEFRLRLATADGRLLGEALIEHYRTGRDETLDAYSATALKRIWKAQRFSWWMTSMLHRFPGGDAFQYRVQLAELEYVTGSTVAAAALA